MIRNMLMIGLCLFVLAGMGGILYWFLKKLAAIERARWGDKANAKDEGLFGSLGKIFKRKSAGNSKASST